MRMESQLFSVQILVCHYALVVKYYKMTGPEPAASKSPVNFFPRRRRSLRMPSREQSRNDAGFEGRPAACLGSKGRSLLKYLAAE